MAFKKLEQKKALNITDAKEVIGYVMAAKSKEQSDGKLTWTYTLQGKASGEIFQMYGSGSIDARMIIGDGLCPNFKGKLFKFTYLGTKKLPGKPSPMKDVDIEMDEEDYIKA